MFNFLRLPFMTLICIVVVLSFNYKTTAGGNKKKPEFYKFINQNDDCNALTIGEDIFKEMIIRSVNRENLLILKSKLNASEFIAQNMISQLNAATQSCMKIDSFSFNAGEEAEKEDVGFSIAPAREFYINSKQFFLKPVKVSDFNEMEKTFLKDYYNLKLRVLTEKVAKAGQALAVAEPDFDGTYNYALVFPMLHSTEHECIDVNVLPSRMINKINLKKLSDSCLMHYRMPYKAMCLLRQSAKLNGKDFTAKDCMIEFAKRAAEKLPNVAAESLKLALEYVPENNEDEIVDIKFKIAEMWISSGNYELASGVAKDIFTEHPDHKLAPEAIWEYYFTLSQSNNFSAILMDIDNAINDEKCIQYRAKLLYTKWWALCRKRNEPLKIAAVEHELIKNYADDPVAAPVYLSQATEMLSKGDYQEAANYLRYVIDKFPDLEAAKQAGKILEKLSSLANIK